MTVSKHGWLTCGSLVRLLHKSISRENRFFIDEEVYTAKRSVGKGAERENVLKQFKNEFNEEKIAEKSRKTCERRFRVLRLNELLVSLRLPWAQRSQNNSEGLLLKLKKNFSNPCKRKVS